jgi:hypothetical protein
LRCGSRLTRVLNRWPEFLSPRERAELESGRVICGPAVFKPETEWVCLACAPAWREVHRLVVQDCEWQLAKEDAVAEADFNRAGILLDQQRKLRPRLTALLECLGGSV